MYTSAICLTAKQMNAFTDAGSGENLATRQEMLHHVAHCKACRTRLAEIHVAKLTQLEKDVDPDECRCQSSACSYCNREGAYIHPDDYEPDYLLDPVRPAHGAVVFRDARIDDDREDLRD